MAKQEISVGDVIARSAAYEHELDTEKMTISMGPSHPNTHGVLRVMLELDGETVTKADPVIGYLHRGEEKIAENMTYNQFVPYTDRLDYLSCLANNCTFAKAVETLAGIEVPERCEAIRVLVWEMSRIASHLIGVGCCAMDCGALTVFMYTFTEREKLYTLFEKLTGARLTTSYSRIGGLARDLPDGFLGEVSKFCNSFLPVLDELDSLLIRNRIYVDRMENIGVISKEDALGYGLSGPNLRASGVPSDLRKDRPYSGYEKYDFDVPIGSKGDCMDRYLVRMAEMRESVKIIRQVIDTMPDGPFRAEDAKKIVSPAKDKVLTDMESLIQNFMITTQGPKIPAGEAYFEAENPKGTLGFFIHSKGGGVPYRLKIRGPSFCTLSILPKVCQGAMIADVVAILGSFDFVMGECDR